jgi:branched-chain amino acid transport system substrate-binding protein
MNSAVIKLARATTTGMAAAMFAAVFALSAPAQAQTVTIGVSVNATGPNAAVGLPYKNLIEAMPGTLAGVPVKYIVMDDGGDPAAAVKNARKFVTEDKVDMILGSTSTPTATAMMDVAVETRTVMIAEAPVAIPQDKFAWVFMVPQPVSMMVEAVVEHMKASGVKSVAYIGYADGWGDLNWKILSELAPKAGIRVLAGERYARADTSVTGQVLKIMATNADAVYIGAAGTPAALPHLTLNERGYKGRVYHTHGTINPDFIRVGGKGVEGGIAPTGPVVVADQLPDSNPIKKAALEFGRIYEAKHGPGRNPFGAYAYDGLKLFEAAIPVAMKRGKPGTPEFRAAMRDALENVKNVVGAHGIYNMSPTDHNGLDNRARVMVHVKDGKWTLLQ